MIALGLMSGTSADGVSAAVVDIGPKRRMRLLSHLTVPYPRALRERVLATAVGRNVAVIVTDRRALGLSPSVGGFFDTPIQLGETVERIVAESNLATVTTARRLLIFRTPTGSWEIRLRNLR